MANFFSDLFGGANNAASDQIAGINAGLNQATGYVNQGNNALTSNFTSGLQPFLQNYSNAQQGVTQLDNVLGINGKAGNQAALGNLTTTPGYQFQLGQGNAAINAAAAANGTLNSGNQATALAKFGQGLAGTTYNNYVNQLQPFLGASNSAAIGIGGLYSGLGSGLNANYNNLGNLAYGAQTSIGNANANADLANQSLGLGILGGGLNLLTGGAGNMFGGYNNSTSSLFGDAGQDALQDMGLL